MRLTLQLRRPVSRLIIQGECFQRLSSFDWTGAADLPFKQNLLSYLQFMNAHDKNRMRYQVDSLEEQVLLKTKHYFYQSLEGSTKDRIIELMRLNLLLLRGAIDMDHKSKYISGDSLLHFIKQDLVHIGDQIKDQGLWEDYQVMDELAQLITVWQRQDGCTQMAQLYNKLVAGRIDIPSGRMLGHLVTTLQINKAHMNSTHHKMVYQSIVSHLEQYTTKLCNDHPKIAMEVMHCISQQQGVSSLKMNMASQLLSNISTILKNDPAIVPPQSSPEKHYKEQLSMDVNTNMMLHSQNYRINRLCLFLIQCMSVPDLPEQLLHNCDRVICDYVSQCKNVRYDSNLYYSLVEYPISRQYMPMMRDRLVTALCHNHSEYLTGSLINTIYSKDASLFPSELHYKVQQLLSKSSYKMSTISRVLRSIYHYDQADISLVIRIFNNLCQAHSMLYHTAQPSRLLSLLRCATLYGLVDHQIYYQVMPILKTSFLNDVPQKQILVGALHQLSQYKHGIEPPLLQIIMEQLENKRILERSRGRDIIQIAHDINVQYCLLPSDKFPGYYNTIWTALQPKIQMENNSILIDSKQISMDQTIRLYQFMFYYGHALEHKEETMKIMNNIQAIVGVPNKEQADDQLVVYQGVLDKVFILKNMQYCKDVMVGIYQVSYLVQQNHIIEILSKEKFLRNGEQLNNDGVLRADHFKKQGYKYSVVRYDPEEQHLSEEIIMERTKNIMESAY